MGKLGLDMYLFFIRCEITLPLYSLLTDEEAKYVITNFVDILKEYGK